jgi:hypothetical protein
MSNIPTAQAVFTEAIVEFLGRSRRFNAIVLVWEQVIPFRTGGFPQMTMWACYNNLPRHSFGAIKLFEPRKNADGQIRWAYSFLDQLKAYQAKINI